MRAYPFGLLLMDNLQKAEEWTVAHSQMTHRNPTALAACAAMALGVALTLRGYEVGPFSMQWSRLVERYSLATADMMRRAISEAQNGSEPQAVLSRLQGWAAHEAISAAVFIVARHASDPVAAIFEGANADGDSHGIASLVGAPVGARAEIQALPFDWVRDVSGLKSSSRWQRVVQKATKKDGFPPFLALRPCLASRRWLAGRPQVSETTPASQPTPPHDVRYRSGWQARDSQQPLVLCFGPWRTAPLSALAASRHHHATSVSLIREPER
jgi:hypothetical protein